MDRQQWIDMIFFQRKYLSATSPMEYAFSENLTQVSLGNLLWKDYSIYR